MIQKIVVSGVVLLLLVAVMPAQTVRITGGTSSLMQLSGGFVQAEGPRYQVTGGAAVIGGNVRWGGALQLRLPRATLTFGDDYVPFTLPSDMLGASASFAMRGASLRTSVGKTSVLLFGGASANVFATNFVRSGEAEETGAVLFLDRPLAKSFRVFSRNFFGRRSTSIHGLEWNARSNCSAGAGAGIGGSEPYFASAFSCQSRWFDLRAGYISAGDKFHRVLVSTPQVVEPDRENVALTFHPGRSLSIGVGRRNLLQPYAEGVGRRAEVNEASASWDPGPLRVGGSFFDSRALPGFHGRGLSLWSGRRFGPVDATFNFLRSWSPKQPASQMYAATVREYVSPKLELLQLITHSAGHISASFGGEWYGNRLSFGVSYQLLYNPFRPAQPFMKSVAIHLRLRLFGGLDVSGNTYVTPAGKIKYTAAGSTSIYRNAAEFGGNPLPVAFNISQWIVRARVIDDSGEPLEGIAVRIGQELAYSGADGRLFVRVKQRSELPVEVLLQESVFPGSFAVYSAPRSVWTQREQDATEATIVLSRAQP